MTMQEIFRSKPSKEDRASVEDERTLIEQAQSGAHYAAAAQWDLIRQYRGLLYATAGKVRARIPGMTPEQVDDLESDLVLAALDAIRDFDLEKHIRLSHTLPTVLNRVVATRTEALTIPRRMVARWSKILREADGDLAKATVNAPKSGMASETFRAIHHALDFDDEEWAEVPYSPADKTAPDELTHALVHRALDALKPSQREVVELAYGFRGDPKSDAEVGDIVGAPMRTVQTKRVRALAKMRAELDGAEQ